MQNRSTDEIADAVCVQRQTSLKCRSGTHCSDWTTGWHWAWRSAMLVPWGCSRDCAQGSESAPAQPGPVAAGDHASKGASTLQILIHRPPTNLGMAVVPVNQSQPHWLSSAIFIFIFFIFTFIIAIDITFLYFSFFRFCFFEVLFCILFFIFVYVWGECCEYH